MLARAGRTQCFLRALLARQGLRLRGVMPAEVRYRERARATHTEVRIVRNTRDALGLQLNLHLLHELERRAQFAPLLMRPRGEAHQKVYGTALTRLIEQIQYRQTAAGESLPARGEPGSAPAVASVTLRHLTSRIERAVRRIELTLRRPAAARPPQEAPRSEPPAPPLRSVRAATRSTNVRSLRAAEGPIPLHPAELARLTEQVIQTIDRRFVAYRERQGG
jgi:hypothetical protein